MISSLVKKTFDFYIAPAKFAFKKVRLFSTELDRFQSDLFEVSSDFVQQMKDEINIDLSSMTEDERFSEAKSALNRAEYNLSSAFKETLKAIILLSPDDKKIQSPHSGRAKIIEGEYERVV